MFMYTPLSKAITESSLWDTPAHVRVLFITMISKMDRDSIVRLDERNLFRAAKLTYEQFKEGLKILQEEDKEDPEELQKDYDGRRIEKVDDGWKVLNGKKYQDEMVAANNRAREAAKKRRQREKDKLAGTGGDE